MGGNAANVNTAACEQLALNDGYSRLAAAILHSGRRSCYGTHVPGGHRENRPVHVEGRRRDLEPPEGGLGLLRTLGSYC